MDLGDVANIYDLTNNGHGHGYDRYGYGTNNRSRGPYLKEAISAMWWLHKLSKEAERLTDSE